MAETIVQHPNVISKTSVRTVFLKAKALIENDDSRKHFERVFHDMESTKEIKIFNYDCSFNRIPHLSEGGHGGQNAILVTEKENSIFIPFYPHNDGSPTCPFVYYKKEPSQKTDEFSGIIPLYLSIDAHIPSPHGYFIPWPSMKTVFFMDNQMDFTEVKNLGQVLIKMVRIMQEAYDKGIPIHPFQSFLLEFPSDVTKETIDTAKLAMCIPDMKIGDLEKWLFQSQNVFLDHFLGWNFGDIIKGSEELETMVLDYHHRMIKDGKRKFAGTGFEVTYRTNGTEVDNFYKFCFPGMEISPVYLFGEATMKIIDDEQSYLSLVAQKYTVPLSDVNKAVDMMNRYLSEYGICTASHPHPEPFGGSLGWIHTPKNSCYVCLTKEGHRMANGLKFLRGEAPTTQISSMEVDVPDGE
ncbi:MAG: hypothetical protein NTY68_05000 [Candidatus Micrarchaeota archaeon]|nr:hypothetical protein [Candidatus Micrarchaeota archaeon]